MEMNGDQIKRLDQEDILDVTIEHELVKIRLAGGGFVFIHPEVETTSHRAMRLCQHQSLSQEAKARLGVDS